MSALARTRKRIESAWRSFVADGRVPDRVRPEILRSWRRSRESHVDPGVRSCPLATSADEVLARAGEDGTLRAASRVVSRIAERLAPDGHVVAYLDGGGVLLAVHGNARTRRRLAAVNFAPGACWAEHVAGTNGIGTALVEERPVEVFASEHFVEAWQPWTCASVPVRFGGRVVGVVDITSPWTARDASLLPTAEALGLAIESQLAVERERMERAVLLQVALDALRAREDFLSVASHELKTPLTPLQLKIQKVQRLVAHAGDGLDPGELVKALSGAELHIGRLVRFVDELIETSRVAREPLRLDLGPMDLCATVRRAVERRRADLQRHRCDAVVTSPVAVVGRWDEARIESAVTQLLVNATKYAPGAIELVVEAERAVARLRVRDHGPGISREDRERIFLPFERAVSCRNASGFGLGLHAVRKIAVAHGGAIRVESELGEGSTFILELPLHRAAAGIAGPPDLAPYPLG